MIQQDYKNSVKETTDGVVTTGFSISINESMFQMLTSNVYNDTTLAVMREWSTNACDACLAADKEVKYDVHIPTVEEPTFFVRDYGTGLKPEDIIGLFSNLGASTKRNSDKYNGTLGIGRMAGLAVSNAFTVESFYDNKRYAYVISMQNGVPVTMHLGTTDTLEPNGLKLSVNVPINDINNYVNRVSNLYKYFDYKPNLNIDADITIDKSEHISDDWFISKGPSKTNYVVMSQVAYAIPHSLEIDTKGFSSLVIKVPPGSVTFNPGRESLSLNKPTINFINSMFEKIANDYAQKAISSFALTNSDYELLNSYYSLVRTIPAKVAKTIDPTNFISQNLKNLFTTSWNYATGTNTISFAYLAPSTLFETATLGLLTLSYKPTYYKTSRPIEATNSISCNSFVKATHIIVDVKTKFKTALNDYYSNTDIVLWQRTKNSDINDAVDMAKTYLKGMGIPYVLTSEVLKNYTTPQKVLEERSGFYASTVPVGSTDIPKSNKMLDEHCHTKTYLYLKTKQFVPQLADSTITFAQYQQMYQKLASIRYMPPVMAVPEKYQNHVNTLSNWIDYETFIKDMLKATSFNEQLSEPIEFMSQSVISLANVSQFPRTIQEFFLENKNKHEFARSKYYIQDEELYKLVTKLSKPVTQYIPLFTVTLSDIKDVYKITWPILKQAIRVTAPNIDYIYTIAKLEDFYAIHSSE